LGAFLRAYYRVDLTPQTLVEAYYCSVQRSYADSVKDSESRRKATDYQGFGGDYCWRVSQVHSAAGWLQPEQTPSSIGRPHFSHGVHPQA